MDRKGEERIIQAELVETTEASVTEPTNVDNSQVLMNMEAMIKQYISSVERLTEEAKKHKDILDDIFKNDPTFQEHSKKAEEAANIKKGTKNEILKRPQARELNEKVKALKSELAEAQVSLSDYLGEYQRMSGISEIEDDKGELYQIVYVAKLRKS